ncbi:tetratricopeptide repeat protein [Paraburkholderia sp. J67]|uniref:O-linked N-acetylglucosamine transferase, SPINDLY family protein n=1 Tax=Paraburkholderia sp. J67 TaxID=2805435 RepID=UPI002ABD7450|nr:tetratricopeptide repeat protein [Paraburkholderia sp. J67]
MEHNQSAYGVALSLMESGNPGRALEQIAVLLEVTPDNANLLNLAGACCHGMGQLTEALAYWERAVQSCPELAEAHSNLGSVLDQLGRQDEAEAALRRALEIAPRFAEANNNLGSLLLATGRTTEAEAALRRALVNRPDYTDARRNLGMALQRLGRFSEAETAYRDVLNAQPHSSRAWNDLGVVLMEQSRLTEAEAAYCHARDIEPHSAMVHANLARLLYGMGRSDDALAAAWRAVELNPAQADTYLILASALDSQNSGDIGPAIAALRRAIELDPDCLAAYSNLAFTLPFTSEDGYELLEESRRLAARFETPALRATVSHTNDRSPQRRLRIGYVSPDFRYHCQCYFMTPLLRHHDHSAYEIYCYSSVRKPDEVTRGLASVVDVWRDVLELSDEELAKQISHDRIDILVDLTMHMKDSRPLLFARRPAPVQVAWLAYPGTTGSRAIDYRLTDPWLDPLGNPGADARYSERSIRLPDTFWCFDPLVTGPAVSALPADENGFVTFGCLNSPRKLTDRALRAWSRVLTSVDGSRMILLVAKGRAREQVSQKFKALGVDPSRLTYVDHQQRSDYLRTYCNIDISLDTLPYNGHTTSLDSFWMGVPVVTVIGNTPVARGGYSLLSNLQLPELAAHSDEAYAQIAVDLARDLPRLRQLRSTLRARIEHSPLMDGERFARSMEAAMRAMWHAWCQQDA